METSKEHLEQLKKQILEHINSTFPEDKKASAIEQVNAMNESQFIEFLKQNNLLKQDGSQPQEGKCIFCSIIFGDLPSTKIAENEKAIAVLEINPLSKGHAIIIPKEHSNKISEEAEKFSEEIKEKLKSVLDPKDIVKEHSEMFGHAIINLIPVYSDEELKERKPADKKELEELQKQLQETKKEEPKEETPLEEINEKNMWLPKRIP